MVFTKACIILVVLVTVNADPMDEMRSMCAGSDTIACLKYKFISFLDSVFQKDSYKLSDGVEVVRNDYRTNNEVTARGEQSLEDTVKEYIQSHDVTFKLPVADSVTVDARDLDNNQLNFKLKISSGVEEGRKKKLKKIVYPIVVLLLLKALTLIPLILGVLGIKTWNALQLSFITFMTSFGMAIFELCRKFAADHTHPTIIHDHWDAHHRSLDEDIQQENAQQLAYNAYY